MQWDLSACGASMKESDLLRLACRIGQPVALARGKAALRLSLSARIVRECWSPDVRSAERNVAALRDDLCIAIRKLDLLVRLYPFSRETSV
jgi:hypothetical protein